MSGMRVVQLFGRERPVMERFARINRDRDEKLRTVRDSASSSFCARPRETTRLATAVTARVAVLAIQMDPLPCIPREWWYS